MNCDYLKLIKNRWIGIGMLVLIPFIMSGCTGSPMSSAKKFVEGFITGNEDTLHRYSTSNAREDLQVYLAIVEDSFGMSGEDLWEEIRENSQFTLQSQGDDTGSVLWEYRDVIKITISLVVENDIWKVDGAEGFGGSPMTSAKKFLEGLIAGNQDILRRYSTPKAQEDIRGFAPILAIVKQSSGLSADDLWGEIDSDSVFTMQSEDLSEASILWEYRDIIKVKMSLTVEDGIWMVDAWEGSDIPVIDEDGDGTEFSEETLD